MEYRTWQDSIAMKFWSRESDGRLIYDYCTYVLTFVNFPTPEMVWKVMRGNWHDGIWRLGNGCGQSFSYWSASITTWDSRDISSAWLVLI
jgi:hypothetical protein